MVAQSSREKGTRAEDNLAALLGPPARWGYEYVEPPSFTPSPERQHPPAREQVRLVPRARAVGKWEATMLATAGAVLAIVLDASFGFFTGGAHGVLATIGVLTTHVIAATIAFFAARAWCRVGVDIPGLGGNVSAAVRRWVIPALNAGGGLLVPYMVLPAEAIHGWRRMAGERDDLVPHPGDARRAEVAYAAATAAWQARITQFEQAERRRIAELAIWRPVSFSRRSQVTCVFGGSPLAWTAALTTLGGSLLGSDARVLIGDLSRRLTVDVLVGRAAAAGIPLEVSALPASAAASDLLAEIGWAELSSVLVEVLHSAQRDPDVSRRERQEDRSLIREVSACLDPAAPVSIARLRAALLAVQDAPVDNAAIGSFERDRLKRLFNRVQRAHGGVLERTIRLERALRDFELLDGVTGTAKAEADEGEAARLRVIGIDKRVDELENDRLVDLLFQLLLRRVRVGSVQADVLIVLGADRIRGEALKALIDHAGQGSAAVVLMFEHLRQDAIDLIGAGGAAAAFMALGNHREAREASEFIGSEYKWVETTYTASASRSLTQAQGDARSGSLRGTVGLPSGVSASTERTKERSYSEAFGRAIEYSAAEERVREAMIEPEVLMALPLTGMILVEVLASGRRQVTNLDCHPGIALSRRVMR